MNRTAPTAPKASISTPVPRSSTRPQGAAAAAAARRAKRASLQPQMTYMHTLAECNCGGTAHNHDDMYYRPPSPPKSTVSDRRRSLPIMSMSTSTPISSDSAIRRCSPSRQPTFAKEFVFPAVEDPREVTIKKKAARKEAKARLTMNDGESKLRSLGLERLSIA